MERTFEIEDAAGKRHVTLAQFRAELDARRADAKPIMDAWKRGDLKASNAAQKAFRAKWS